MKKQVKNFMLLMFTLCAVSLVDAQEKSKEFEVLGNCNGCKKRIEKAANDFKICFISNNQETRDFLATKLLSFSNNLPIPSEHSLNIHIFSSYKEMDHAFSNKQNSP